jgi:hypothetical protein
LLNIFVFCEPIIFSNSYFLKGQLSIFSRSRVFIIHNPSPHSHWNRRETGPKTTSVACKSKEKTLKQVFFCFFSWTCVKKRKLWKFPHLLFNCQRSNPRRL